MKTEFPDLLLKLLALLISAAVNAAITLAFIFALEYNTIQPLLRVTCALALLCAVGFGGYFAVGYFKKRAQEAKLAAGHFVDITDG